MREAIAGTLVGARVKRVEDQRLLAGAGPLRRRRHGARACSTPPSCAAPTPTPRSASIDLGGRPGQPGVHLVLTGADMRATHLPASSGTLTLPGVYEPDLLGAGHRPGPPRGRPGGHRGGRLPAAGRGRLRAHRGRLPAARRRWPTVEQALDTEPGRWSGPRPRATSATRRARRTATSTPPSPRADRVIVERFDQHRHSNQPMETRGIVAEIDPATGAPDDPRLDPVGPHAQVEHGPAHRPAAAAPGRPADDPPEGPHQGDLRRHGAPT